jgi:hypothetical protein
MALVEKIKPDLIVPFNDQIPVKYISDTPPVGNVYYISYKINISDDNIINSSGTTYTNEIVLDIWCNINTDDDVNYSVLDINNFISNNKIINNYIDDILSNFNISKPTKSILLSKIKVEASVISTVVLYTSLFEFFSFIGTIQYDNTDWNYLNYMMSGGTISNFLSKWEGDRTYTIDDYATINVFNGTFKEFVVDNRESYSTGDDLYIEIFDYNGLSNTYQIDLSGSTNPSILYLPLGPKNIENSITDGFLYSGSTQILTDVIDTNTDYYEVWINSDTDGRLSEKIKVVLDHDYLKWDGVNLIWMGELSTYESFRFRFSDIKSYDINRIIHKKSMNRNSTTYKNNKFIIDIDNEISEKHKVQSGWLDTDQSKNLMELYKSNFVYIVKDDELVPIVLLNTSIEEKNITQNRLFNHTIDYLISYNAKSNR